MNSTPWQVSASAIWVSSESREIPIAWFEVCLEEVSMHPTEKPRGTLRSTNLLLRQVIQSRIRQMEVVLDDLLRRQCQPLRHTDIRELGLLQHLEEDDVFGAGVLDVMGVRCGNVADVSSSIVECLCRFGSHVYRDAC